jgi:hypothetical protein
MNYVHFFQWNIPKDNHLFGATDEYINVIAKWDGTSFYSENRPIVFRNPVNMRFSDAMQVKDWRKAIAQIDNIAEEHFAEIAKQERLNQARAILAVEDHPILSRLQIAEA